MNMFKQNTNPNLQPIDPKQRFRKESINTTDSDSKMDNMPKQGFFSRMIWGTSERTELPQDINDKQYSIMFGPKRRNSHILIQKNMLQETNFQRVRRYSSITDSTSLGLAKNQMPTTSINDFGSMGM